MSYMPCPFRDRRKALCYYKKHIDNWTGVFLGLTGGKGMKGRLGELLRYAVVGGLSFAVDFTLLFLLRETVCAGSIYGLYLAAVGGFLGGIAVNTCLSVRFVFRNPAVVQQGRGKNPRDVLTIILIGVVGLLLTELGMFIGVELLLFNYLLVKIITSGAVMLWNYEARRRLVFSAAGQQGKALAKEQIY